MTPKTSKAIAGAAGVLGVLTGLGYRRFQHDLRAAQVRVGASSALAITPHGPIEYAQIGQGKPLLIVHGAGGGYDQGLLFARPLADRGFRVTAMSRFGYLRTPLPADASPQAQADAHASLLDALQIGKTVIIGASAGAPSAMQFAIRHADRCSALILLVPLVWKPQDAPDSVPKRSKFEEVLVERLVGSDFLFWLALHFARGALIKRVLGTPPSLVATASPSEQARVDEILRTIMPLRRRTSGLRNEANMANALTRYDLDAIQTPTLVLSLRDDLYGTFAGARYTATHIRGARFVAYEHGGHVWVGQHAAVLDEIAAFAARA